jgi:hypothetical protein
MAERKTPNSLEAEKAVLGSAFLSKSALQKICDELSSDAFYHDANKLIFETYGKNSFNGYNLHFAKTYDAESQAIQDYYILVNSQNKVIADSVVCNFKFESNIKAGDSITKEDNTYLKEPIMYADNNGEFKYLDLFFGAGEEQRNVTDLEIVRKYPKVENVDTSNLEFETFLINKDNREITSISMQFRFVGDDDTIVYNDFAKYLCKTFDNFSEILDYKGEDFADTVATDDVLLHKESESNMERFMSTLTLKQRRRLEMRLEGKNIRQIAQEEKADYKSVKETFLQIQKKFKLFFKTPPKLPLENLRIVKGVAKRSSKKEIKR